MIGEILDRVRLKRPLVHCISNCVTANDCANILLACGASPVMAEDPMESAEITSHAQGLVLNLGMPTLSKIEAMLLSGRCANEHGIPVVFDPVGAAASTMRLNAARQMMNSIRFSVIRGNADEIKALLEGSMSGAGVDALEKEAGLETNEYTARRLAQKLGCVVSMSAKIDIVTDGQMLYRVHNGHEMMRQVTGTGCQLSALTGAYTAANPKDPLASALAAVSVMGICGEKAYERLIKEEGNAAMRNYIIDAVCRMTAKEAEERAKYEHIR